MGAWGWGRWAQIQGGLGLVPEGLGGLTRERGHKRDTKGTQKGHKRDIKGNLLTAGPLGIGTGVVGSRAGRTGPEERTRPDMTQAHALFKIS